jgi:transketolase
VTPALYPTHETFPVGRSKVLRASDADVATIVAAGVTVHEALLAASRLADEGMAVRVIDAYSVKPLDAVTIRAALAQTRHVVVVEDHWPEGGLGDAVLEAAADLPGRVQKIAVTEMPGSGSGAELRDLAGISADHIAASLRHSLVGAVHERSTS